MLPPTLIRGPLRPKHKEASKTERVAYSGRSRIADHLYVQMIPTQALNTCLRDVYTTDLRLLVFG